MDSGRLEAFSDGVFAVAITLLALNLAVPGPGHSRLTRQLADHWPSYAAYLVSFLTIGIIWVNHHTLFRNFAKIDRTLLFLNLLLLFFVVAIPFATATIAAYHSHGGAGASFPLSLTSLLLIKSMISSSAKDGTASAFVLSFSTSTRSWLTDST